MVRHSADLRIANVRNAAPAETGGDLATVNAISPPAAHDLVSRLEQLLTRLDQIEIALSALTSQRAVKEWYSIAEVAEQLGNAPFTVREWARHRRINAEKRRCGRGKHREWMISHAELNRIRNEGLLPPPEL
jgi:hypothetical protein